MGESGVDDLKVPTSGQVSPGDVMDNMMMRFNMALWYL